MHKFQGQRLQWTSSRAWGIQLSSHPQTSYHQGGGIHHIFIISRVSRTPTPLIKWEQRLFQEYHHHIQGLHIIKNISNGSTIYHHQHKSTNTPKEGYKDLSTSLQHLMTCQWPYNVQGPSNYHMHGFKTQNSKETNDPIRMGSVRIQDHITITHI